MLLFFNWNYCGSLMIWLQRVEELINIFNCQYYNFIAIGSVSHYWLNFTFSTSGFQSLYFVTTTKIPLLSYFERLERWNDTSLANFSPPLWEFTYGTTFTVFTAVMLSKFFCHKLFFILIVTIFNGTKGNAVVYLSQLSRPIPHVKGPPFGTH